jgi:hypothetical protein
MHIGPFATEEQTIEKMERFLEEHRYSSGQTSRNLSQRSAQNGSREDAYSSQTPDKALLSQTTLLL